MEGLNLTRQIILAGTVGTAVPFFITIFRHRKFESKDIALCLGGFLFGANIPPSIFLCIYAFTPDEAIKNTRLAGYEWYLFFAGVAMPLFGIEQLITIIKKAVKG
jgi:TRAP-type C4-dicarboxylate transport system permease large subunit